jgi:hypothetical protein
MVGYVVFTATLMKSREGKQHANQTKQNHFSPLFFSPFILHFHFVADHVNFVAVGVALCVLYHTPPSSNP